MINFIDYHYQKMVQYQNFAPNPHHLILGCCQFARIGQGNQSGIRVVQVQKDYHRLHIFLQAGTPGNTAKKPSNDAGS